MINVYIMSGPPGSGKSHHARAFVKVMVDEGEIGVIVSADHFWSPGVPMAISFLELEGYQEELKTYEFENSKLSKAHQKCMKAFINALRIFGARNASIIVDNTNIRSYEISPYYLVAEAFGAKVEILRVETPLEDCLARNTHAVPEHIITGMHGVHATKSPHPYEEGTLPEQHMPWWESRTI